MAPTLIANVLTVVFVYCFAVIGQQERNGDEEGRFTYLWLIVLIFLFMLYGLYSGAFIHSISRSGVPPRPTATHHYVKRDQQRDEAFFNKHTMTDPKHSPSNCRTSVPAARFGS